METNLLWMAGSLTPPVNYTQSGRAEPKQWRLLMKGKENMMGNDFFTCRYDKESTFTFSHVTLYSAHSVHFHHSMDYTNAIIIVNVITGTDNLSLLAAQPLPTLFSRCAACRKN